VTVLSDGAEGPRALGEAASPGPTHHVLDWFHLSMRIQHVDQAAQSWSDVSADDRRTGTDLVEIIDRIRWRLCTARSLGASISLAIRWSRSTVSSTPRGWPPSRREKWRVCCATSRHIFADNPTSLSITPRHGGRVSRFRRRSQKVPCSGCCTGE